MEDLTTKTFPPGGASRDSLALKRVKKHSYNDEYDLRNGPNGTEKTRQEGIYLKLDQLQFLIDYLKRHHQHINRVAFMIGKLDANDGGRRLSGRLPSTPGSLTNELEYTVEVLPYEFDEVKGTSEFLTVNGVIGFLKIDGYPFDNDFVDGGGGGNQKTPPPFPKTP